jgi:hypothetical protein
MAIPDVVAATAAIDAAFINARRPIMNSSIDSVVFFKLPLHSQWRQAGTMCKISAVNRRQKPTTLPEEQ